MAKDLKMATVKGLMGVHPPSIAKGSFLCQIHLNKTGNRKTRKPSLGIPEVNYTWSRVEASRKADERLPGDLSQGVVWITKDTKGTMKILELFD